MFLMRLATPRGGGRGAPVLHPYRAGLPPRRHAARAVAMESLSRLFSGKAASNAGVAGPGPSVLGPSSGDARQSPDQGLLGALGNDSAMLQHAQVLCNVPWVPVLARPARGRIRRGQGSGISVWSSLLLQKLWQHLDELAANDPEGYRKFLDQQAKAAGVQQPTSGGAGKVRFAAHGSRHAGHAAARSSVSTPRLCRRRRPSS